MMQHLRHLPDDQYCLLPMPHVMVSIGVLRQILCELHLFLLDLCFESAPELSSLAILHKI